MKFYLYLILGTVVLFFGCIAPQNPPAADGPTLESYFAAQGDGIQTGGVKVIPIETGGKTFNIWTKRFGNNPKIKLLLLQGGPGCTHEYWECMESFLPAEGIEFIYYDQLGTGFSDNPADTAFWDLPRYVEEVEMVRKALNLNKDNFYLLGHSWGGILGMQYALKYQDNLKGLIISNMMMSCPEYDRYADEVLAKTMDPEALQGIRDIEAANDFDNPRYMEILTPHFYEKHICRMPAAEWPEPVVRSFGKINHSLYVTMQGPSEFGIGGRLAQWDVKDRLPEIKVPTLTIGATHDTMDPEHMKWVSTAVQKGRFLLCSNGSHMCMWDDQKTYMAGLIAFLKDVDKGAF
ncbi:MAG: proline iminopeptidase-family hydrolase [Lewinellaceae bacterium]|nr:proline iminopeptidase-family hydrolase [Saprospiraceae bacterium]MCB9333391.1 proline iminopeptidase-family hydrolase [Lewinellaceae bacterium]